MQDQPDPLPFEEALQKLERLVTELESAELPLETALQRYEEAQKLVQFCQQQLQHAQLRVEMLSADGELHPFPLTD